MDWLNWECKCEFLATRWTFALQHSITKVQDSGFLGGFMS